MIRISCTFCRLLSRVIAYTNTWSNYFVRTLIEVPFLMTIIILPLNFAICGALTMIISLLLYFTKLTRMYENYLEELFMASLQHFKWFKGFKRTKSEESNDRKYTSENVYNHLVLFLLFSFTAILAIPSILVWAKNFRYCILRKKIFLFQSKSQISYLLMRTN